MKKLNLKLDKNLSDVISDAAQVCNCTPEEIIENILYARLADNSARQSVFEDYPELAVAPEFITQNNKLMLSGQELFKTVFETRKVEITELQILRTLFHKIYSTKIEGGNA